MCECVGVGAGVRRRSFGGGRMADVGERRKMWRTEAEAEAEVAGVGVKGTLARAEERGPPEEALTQPPMAHAATAARRQRGCGTTASV